MTDVADTKTCPYCAETIKAAAIVCRYCGRDLPRDDDSAINIYKTTKINERSINNMGEIYSVPFYKIWFYVLIKPAQQTFIRIAGAKNAKLWAALLWVLLLNFILCTLFFFETSKSLSNLTTSEMWKMLDRLIFWWLRLGIPLSLARAIANVIVFLIGSSFIFGGSRMFGGKSTFSKLGVSLASVTLVIVSLEILVEILLLFTGAPADKGSVSLSASWFNWVIYPLIIYEVVLYTIATKAMTQIKWWQASILTVLWMVLNLIFVMVIQFLWGISIMILNAG